MENKNIERSDYSKGLEAGFKGADVGFKKVAPYWVYGAVDTTKLGLELRYLFVGAFKNRDDAEAFIDYRKKNVRKSETIFKIEDYSNLLEEVEA